MLGHFCTCPQSYEVCHHVCVSVLQSGSPPRAPPQGQNCEVKVNYCQPNPCFNSGTCTAMSDGPSCQCLPEFSGLMCQLQTTPSSVTPPTPSDLSVTPSSLAGVVDSRLGGRGGGGALIGGLVAGLLVLLLLVVGLVVTAVLVTISRRRKSPGEGRG